MTWIFSSCDVGNFVGTPPIFYDFSLVSKSSINTCTCIQNFKCHNIYRDPLFLLAKNGHLIVLTCISFFNEHPFVFMRGGDIHTRVILSYFFFGGGGGRFTEV